jgi:hypothetical protein
MADITREELNAFTSAHEKTATVLEKIAGQLEQITTKTDKLIEKLDNGLVTSVIDGVTHNYNAVHKETIDCLSRVEKAIENNRSILADKVPDELAEKLANSSIAKDIDKAKWFIGIVGIVVVIAIVIIRGIDTRFILTKDTSTLQQLLKEHVGQSGELK